MNTDNSTQHASTSQNPDMTVPATYHPELRPPPAPLSIVYERMDTHAIKQELHDALGEDGLPYWKALNGYLLGQIGRGELEGMVKAWFKGPKVTLHNKLLLSLLHNAGSSPPKYAPISSLNQKKRKRVAYDDPEFDTDETTVEPKARVSNWVMGLGGRERARVRRAVLGKQVDKDDAAEDGEGELEDERDKGKWTTFGNNSLPPLAVPARSLPSSQQLSLRLSQFAKTHDLSLAPDSMGEIGEFMAVGMDSYLGDVFHGIVHLTGRDRPGGGTIHLPQSRSERTIEVETETEPDDRLPNGNGNGKSNGYMDIKEKEKSSLGRKNSTEERGRSMPKPDINTLQHLFTLNPSLHPQASPSLHRLSTSHTLGEIEATTPSITTRHRNTSVNGVGIGKGVSINRAESVSQNLLSTGLLKLDKAGRQEDVAAAGEKKERKHTLHWKYEDPALILRDVLG